MWGFGAPASGLGAGVAAAPAPDERWHEADAAGACPVLVVGGAAGQFGDDWTNGVYDIEVLSPELPPVWVKREGAYERFLYFDAAQTWRVGGGEHKEKLLAAAGSMCSAKPEALGTLPTGVRSWSVRTGYSAWEEQRVTVSARPPTPGRRLRVGLLAAPPEAGVAGALAENASGGGYPDG